MTLIISCDLKEKLIKGKKAIQQSYHESANEISLAENPNGTQGGSSFVCAKDSLPVVIFDAESNYFKFCNQGHWMTVDKGSLDTQSLKHKVMKEERRQKRGMRRGRKKEHKEHKGTEEHAEKEDVQKAVFELENSEKTHDKTTFRCRPSKQHSKSFLCSY